MNILLSVLMVLIGFFLVSITMERHSKGFSMTNKYLFRILGWIILFIALFPCIKEWNTAIGIAAWFGIMSLTGSIFVMVLSYLPENKLIK
ncbi:MAG TPA: hypothetical protein DCM31_11985 [Deferribacteraceae bacterium]|jgi:cytochrome bd-type quinol oxidase subunit 2|nr:hypothetical protein [Deferribacteraceae bacterium]